MRYGSVCSGIEAASVAWEPLGWQPAFFAEIDPFPSAVLAHRFPNVPNAGDFTQIRKGQYDDIDLLVGGTPCQDFSVAGRRAGWSGERGGLTGAFVDLVRCLKPRWVVWENVPGVLAGDCRRGFFRFLRALAGRGYHVAWRVLDAQYVRVDGLERAVPQRRRRVFVVGHLGDWRPPAAVLFEPESVRGDSPPRREAGERVAPTIRSGAANDSAGRGARSGDSKDELIVACLAHGQGGAEIGENLCTTLNCNHEAPIAFEPRYYTRGQGAAKGDDVTGALQSGACGSSDKAPHVAQACAVRRLTPRECERLQGFPDDWTLVPYRNKPASDGPRYKALGNSMAVNVMRWIGGRIESWEAMERD